jgi:hypothetical protein
LSFAERFWTAETSAILQLVFSVLVKAGATAWRALCLEQNTQLGFGPLDFFKGASVGCGRADVVGFLDPDVRQTEARSMKVSNFFQFESGRLK